MCVWFYLYWFVCVWCVKVCCRGVEMVIVVVCVGCVLCGANEVMMLVMM